MDKVLVTGCAGYIGCRLVRRLLDYSYQVIGLDSLFYEQGQVLLPYLGHTDFIFHKGSVVTDTALLRELVGKADVVIHLAALVGAPVCERMPQYAWDTNYLATVGLADMLSPSQRLVYLNTNSGYGAAGEAPCTESTPLNPVSMYGRSKVYAENAVLNRPNSVSLRLGTVFGASGRMRFDLLVNDFTEKLWDIRERPGPDRKLTLYQPHFRRAYVHIEDVCRAVVYVLFAAEMKGAYNVANPNLNRTKAELAHNIATELGLSPDVVVIGNGEDPDKRDYYVSSEKLLATGFHFQQGLAQGVREVVAVCDVTSEEERRRMRNA